MKTPEPTTWQRVVASPWLPNVWLGCGAVVAAALAFAVGQFQFTLHTLPGLVLALAAMALALLLGVFSSGLFSWFVLGPLYYEQGFANGGPFEIGDKVMILAGRHRDSIGHVYSAWQHDALRVDLGDEAKANDTDIFSAHEILRVGDAPQGGEEPSCLEQGE